MCGPYWVLGAIMTVSSSFQWGSPHLVLCPRFEGLAEFLLWPFASLVSFLVGICGPFGLPSLPFSFQFLIWAVVPLPAIVVD